MANTAAKPNLNLRLLIDKEKNKVVLAEAGKDFVDVLFSLLTLPMGTIVRLLEKHQKPQSSIVGCFHNLYKSVSDMDVHDFNSYACKNMLLYPRSVYEMESRRRKLNLNIDDTEATKFFICPWYITFDQCYEVFSYLSTTSCSLCGNLMTHEVEVAEEQANEVFVGCRTSFIITDDLKVALNSTGHVLHVLNDLGYDGFDKLNEMLVDVGLQEVVTLLGCLFTSEAPLTDSFLREKCMARKRKMSIPLVHESAIARDSDKLLTLKVYVRKTDGVILYAECGEDFVDFLFTFLAIPLQFAWELSFHNANVGCIGNLCRSLKELSFEQLGKSQVHKCILPYYYNIPAQLLDIDVEGVQEYKLLVSNWNRSCGKLSKMFHQYQLSPGQKILKLKPEDSNGKVTSGSAGMGFLKGESNFIVSNEMSVVPMKLCPTILFLTKLNLKINDIEEQVISLGKSEAISLLRASLCTTSALNDGLSNFLSNLKSTPSSSNSQTSQKRSRKKRL